MKIIITILIICTDFVKSLSTLNLSNSCTCSELFYEDCISGQSNCAWNLETKECIEVACSNIEGSNHCVWSSQRCYWYNKQCYDFTSCEAIPGKDQQECMAANINCPASNGINCLSMEYQKKCSVIKDPDLCNDYYSSDGQCMWNGADCILLKSCTQLWTNQTKSCFQRGCYFDSLSHSCQDMKCSKHQTQSQCQFGVSTVGPYLNNVIPCEWDTLGEFCSEAKPQDYGIDQCYSNSARTYHWSKSSPTKGKCVACCSSILYIMILGLMMVIIT